MSTDDEVTRSDQGRAERIESAALDLLERGGMEAVTSRAVAETAGVRPMAIYRSYGDMSGLMNAVLSRGFHEYLTAKIDRPRLEDPVDDLRQGWDLHVGFGLEHPHVYAAMYSSPDPVSVPDAVIKADRILEEIVERIAKAGRLATNVAAATAMIGAAGRGATLTLIATPPAQRDPGLSHELREAVLATVTTEPPAEAPNRARHAAALAATIDDGPAVLSNAERELLGEWLHRLT